MSSYCFDLISYIFGELRFVLHNSKKKKDYKISVCYETNHFPNLKKLLSH